jgi:hypothetical protein
MLWCKKCLRQLFGGKKCALFDQNPGTIYFMLITT